MCLPLGTQPTTQASALTGNQTSDPLLDRPVLNPLSYTSQGVHLSLEIVPFMDRASPQTG